MIAYDEIALYYVGFNETEALNDEPFDRFVDAADYAFWEANHLEREMGIWLITTESRLVARIYP